MFSMTAELIRKTPLRRGAKIEEVVGWVKHVAPCLAQGYAQSREDTDMIVWHLMKSGLDAKSIAAALIGSGYEWTVSDMSVNVAIVNWRMALDANRRKNNPMPDPPRMGRPAPPNKSALKERAQYLDARFRANAHDPELQAQLLKEFVDLLHEAEGGDGGDLPPGGGSLARERERLRQTREEILRNSPNIARIVRNLGPLELDRIRRLPPGPDGSTVRRINQNTYRITPPRRAR